MDTVSPAAVPAPELTAQQREFLRALRAGELHGQIAAMAYELGYSEALAPAPAPKRRRHLTAVAS